MALTDAEKQERKELRLARRAETLRLNAEAREKVAAAEVRSVWEHIQPEDRPKFEYIEKQLASGRRDPEDEIVLRDARATHFRQYRRYIPATQEVTNG